MPIESDGLSLEFKEGESGFLMHVQRVIKTREDRYRRPIFSYGEERQFESPGEALSWIEEGGNSWHIVEVVFPGIEMEAGLIGEKNFDDELLIIKTSETQGASPRSINGHHAVSTDRINFFNIIVQLGSDYDLDPLFDRSIAHINIEAKDNLKLSFTLKGGEFGEEELAQGFIRLQNRVTEVMNSLVQGIIKEEHINTLITEGFFS